MFVDQVVTPLVTKSGILIEVANRQDKRFCQLVCRGSGLEVMLPSRSIGKSTDALETPGFVQIGAEK